jgi:hypothetical protein
MKPLKTAGFVLLLALAGLLPACRTTTPSTPPSQADLLELTQTSYLQMVMRYLYRWQLDHSEFEHLVSHKNIVFWVRPLQLKLDPGDHSKFADLLLPQLNITLRVKKADYTIAETGEVVTSKGFKIVRVSRGEVPWYRGLPWVQPRGSSVATLDSKDTLDYLFQKRFQIDLFDPEVAQHLLDVAREQAAKEGLSNSNVLNGQQLICIAPPSPVANETWVLWEIRRKLFYIASDIDLTNPAVWKYQNLTIRTFDLVKQVVVSHEEVSGSNFYMTRHHLSKVLFNCIVLGQRINFSPNSFTNSTSTNSVPSPTK